MEKSEYYTQLRSIFNLAALVRRLNIQGVLQAMNYAETLGPIIDPTLYLKSAKSFEWQKQTVEAALQFQQAVGKIVSNPRYSQHTGEK
jgi:hypothetical protein